jgi:hypothetical protein
MIEAVDAVDKSGRGGDNTITVSWEERCRFMVSRETINRLNEE